MCFNTKMDPFKICLKSNDNDQHGGVPIGADRDLAETEIRIGKLSL